MTRHIKNSSFLLGCLVIGLALGVFFAFRSESAIPHPVANLPKISLPEPSLTLMFVGDIMMDRGVELSVNKNFGGDFNLLLEHVNYLKKADFAIGNLEGPVSDQGKNVGSKYSFRMDPAIIPTLANAGFDAFSLANNHAGDWTLAAHNDTRNRLTTAGIKTIGSGSTITEALTPTVLTKKGISVALFSCTDVGPEWLAADTTNSGILLCKNPGLVPAITAAQTKYDTVIVTPHWGEEYVGYNNRQQELAHAWVDAGADAVIGHHPHVIQATEWYGEGFIAYSLGNFIFDQYFSPETLRGMVLEMTVSRSGVIAVQPKISEQTQSTFQLQPLRELMDSDIVIKQSPPKVAFTCPAANVGAFDDLAPVSHGFSIKDYIPENLVSVAGILPTGGRNMCLKQSTVDALKLMFADAKAAGFPLTLTSGFRDPGHQKELWDADQARINGDITLMPIAAAPGTSEHQLGTAVDMVSLNALTLEAFSESPDYEWLKDNAYKYGFVQSYPEDREEETGYSAEPWHWRYVGKTHARKIHQHNKVLLEYLQDLND